MRVGAAVRRCNCSNMLSLAVERPKTSVFLTFTDWIMLPLSRDYIFKDEIFARWILVPVGMNVYLLRDKR